MPDSGRFAVYFSHSWRPRDVELNLQVWEQLARDCELLVDMPDEPGANPPYYINRIEELFRRTDFFLSVLTYREPKQGDFEQVDAQLRCSPYSVFEIRLAERADRPRLILYERSTGFRPPQRIRPRSQPQDLPQLIEPRIAAMFRLSPALRDGGGADYLQSKRYSQFFVFLSHTLKPPHREVVDQIYALLKSHHVTPFEYHQVNTAGMDWRLALTDALQKTTHFIALLSPDYEQSQTCTLELETILARGEQVSILPFMLANRDRPNPKLGDLHNKLLSDSDPRADAQVVVDEVMGALDVALKNSDP
jgi:hypothetical protein